MGDGWSGPPVVAAGQGGNLSVFLIGDDGALYRYDQQGANWSVAQRMQDWHWQHAAPVMAANPTGGLSVFLLGENRALYRSFALSSS
jgi:hypothetical protein